jgi:hypothetical protein
LAYATISDFEPTRQYRWTEADLIEPAIRANLLRGDRLDRGAQPYEGERWSGRDDPVFRFAMEVVADTIRRDAGDLFESEPVDAFDWCRLFRLQSGYLLLWAVVERLAALAYGPMLDPMAKVNSLGPDSDFQEILRQVVRPNEAAAFDSRDPKKRYRLDRDQPDRAPLYFYAVRSNLSHRGKGAYNDGEISGSRK